MNFIFTTKDGTKLFPIPPNQEPTHLVNEDYTEMYSVSSWNDDLTFKGGIGTLMKNSTELDIVSVKEIVR